MKNNTEALKKEIKGRATALAVTFGVLDLVMIIMLAVMWKEKAARMALLFVVVWFTVVVILAIAAARNPLKYKRSFRNLRAEKEAKPKPVPKKAAYSHDKGYGFVSTVFNRPVSVSALNVSEGYVKKCIDFFQNMSEEQKDRLAEEATAYYREIQEYSGDTDSKMPEELSGREILDWVYPKVMWIGNDEGKEDPVEFIVECDCEWEAEHGMEIVVSDGKIIHVGSYDGDLDYWKEAFLSNQAD